MNILVAGGTGFVGSNLCEKLLLTTKNNIYCLDNNYTGSNDNISHLLDNPRFFLIHHDINNNNLFLKEKIDYIYNLACPASPKAYQKDPIYTIKTCVYGTINLLEIAKKHNARILLTSTSEIYGDPKEHPQKETYRGNVNTIGIRSCYDEGKRIGETIMMEYKRCYNVDIRIARLFNTYGPNMSIDDGRVVSNFINQCIYNKDITIYGDGSQTRSFCYVTDTVDCLIKLMESDYSHPINIGNPNENSIKFLANFILNKISDSISNIVYKDLPKDDPCLRKPDITLANNVLKWEPKITLDDGIERTIDYFKQLYKIPSIETNNTKIV
jgi:UDP-glucuronate decarboxylase